MNDTKPPLMSAWRGVSGPQFATVTLAEIVAVVRGGGGTQFASEVRRQWTAFERGSGDRDRLKQALIAVTPSAAFESARGRAAPHVHSGYVVIDYDHVHDARALRDQLGALAYVALAFVSPSGDGAKAFVPVAPSPDGAETHGAAYATVCERLRGDVNADIDTGGSDVSRLCFLPVDADAVVRWDAIPVTWQCPPPPKGVPPPRPTAAERGQHGGPIYDKGAQKLADLALGKLAGAREGNRNDTLYEAAASLYGIAYANRCDLNWAEQVLRAEAERLDLPESEYEATLGSARKFADANPLQSREPPMRNGASANGRRPDPEGSGTDPTRGNDKYRASGKTYSATDGDGDGIRTATQGREFAMTLARDLALEWATANGVFALEGTIYSHDPADRIHKALLDAQVNARLDKALTQRGHPAVPRDAIKSARDYLIDEFAAVDIGRPMLRDAAGKISALPAGAPFRDSYVTLSASDAPYLRKRGGDQFHRFHLGADWDLAAFERGRSGGDGPPMLAQFLRDTFGDSDDGCIYQTQLAALGGYTLSGSRDAQLIVICYGGSGTGKSAWARILSGLLGGAGVQGGVLSVGSVDALADRFAIADGAGRYALMLRDLPPPPRGARNRREFESGLAVIKQISGGDSMDVQPKYKSRVTMQLPLQVWAASNHAPTWISNMADADAWSRRLFVLPFRRNAAARGHADNDALPELIVREEGGVAASWMLGVYQRLIDQAAADSVTFRTALCETDAQAAGMETLVTQSLSPQQAFVRTCIVAASGELEVLSRKDVLSAYADYIDCGNDADIPQRERSAIYAAIDAFPEATPYKRREGWRGVQLANPMFW